MEQRDRRVQGPAGRRHPGVVAVGLTGGIGAGKSTALSLFAELGAVTTSADRIVHELYERPDYISRLVDRFGNDVMTETGGIDRRRLSQRVKGNRGDLRWLEELTHPLVASAIERIVDKAAVGSVVVCEVPLLFETGFESLFDVVVTIEADRANRVLRSARRFDPALFDEFEALQATTEERVAGSDFTYFNDGSVEHMRVFVQRTFEQLLSRPEDL